MNAAGDSVLPAVRASSASGYILKNICPGELEKAIRAVAGGETYLTPVVSGFLIDDCRRHAADASDSLAKLTRRTPRPARGCSSWLQEGNSTKQIARRLAVSVKTVETYRSQLMELLDIHDIAGLTRYAIRKGMVSSNS